MANKTLELALRIVAEATGKQNIEQLVTELKNIEQSADAAKPATKNLSDLINELEQRVKNAAPQTQQLNDEIENIAKSTNNASPQAELFSNNLENVSKSAQKTNSKIRELEAASRLLADQLANIEAQKAAVGRYEQLSQSLKENEQAYIEAGKSLNELVDKQKEAKQTDADYINSIKNAENELATLTQKQKEAATGTEQYTSAIQQQQTQLTQLKINQQLAAKELLEYDLQVNQARTSINSLNTTVINNRSEFKKLENALTDAGKNLNNLREETHNLDQQLVAADIAISDVNNELEKHQKLLDASNKSAADYDGNIKNVIQDLIVMAGAFLSLDKAKDSLLNILSVGDKAQAFSAQMTAMMGSIAAGEQATKWIRTFANDTGTELETARQSFAALKTFGIDPMGGAMQSLVDYNAKLGGSQEKLSGIILAAGQAWAKQKLQGEEILQMVERGVPVWELLSKVTGKNTVELQKMSEKGQLSRETMKALFDEMGKQAEGQAAKSLDRLSGQVTLMNNKWELFKVSIAASGVYKVAIDFMKQLNDQFDRMVKDGSIDLAAKKISEFFSSIITDGGESIKTLLDNIDSFITGAERIVGAVRIVFNGFTAGIKTVALAATTYASSMTSAFASVLDFVGASDLAQKAQFQADALKAVSDGFHESILEDGKNLNAAWEQLTQTSSEAIKTTVKSASDAVAESTAAQKANIDTVTAATGQSVVDIGVIMSRAGIITTDSLKSTEEEAKKVYDTLLASYKKNEIGVYELEQAYLKWASAAVSTTAATKDTVPATVAAAAAALGLTNELDKLIETANKLAPANDTNSDAVNRFTAEIKATNEAIEQNKKVIDSSNASAAEKAEAQRLLTIQQERLVEQTTDLTKVQALEESNLYALQKEQNALNAELTKLNASYATGTITAEEYAYEKERISSILAVVNDLLGDFKTAQDAATVSTKAATNATKEQTKASELSSKSLREQRDELEEVSRSATSAANSVSRYNSAAAGTVNSVVDYQEKNGTAYQYNSREIQAEKAKRLNQGYSDDQFGRLSASIDGASSASKLNDIYAQINKQLNYLSKEQKSTLNAAIIAQREAIKAQSNTTKAVAQTQAYTPTYTPTQTYTQQTPTYAQSNSVSNTPSNSALNSLAAVVKELTAALKAQPIAGTSSSNTLKTLRLELALPDKQLIYGEFEERFLQTLEQLSNTQ